VEADACRNVFTADLGRLPGLKRQGGKHTLQRPKTSAAHWQRLAGPARGLRRLAGRGGRLGGAALSGMGEPSAGKGDAPSPGWPIKDRDGYITV